MPTRYASRPMQAAAKANEARRDHEPPLHAPAVSLQISYFHIHCIDIDVLNPLTVHGRVRGAGQSGSSSPHIQIQVIRDFASAWPIAGSGTEQRRREPEGW